MVESNQIKAINSIKDINLKFPFNTMVKNSKKNLSNVPTRDLNLIYSYALLWSFYNKAELRSCKNLIAATYKGVSDFLSHNANSGYKGASFLAFLYGVAYTYGSAILRVIFLRSTAKKYGLRVR